MIWSLVAVLTSIGMSDVLTLAVPGAGPWPVAATVAALLAVIAVGRYACRRLHGAASGLAPAFSTRRKHTDTVRPVRTRTEVRGRPRPRAPSTAPTAA
ncbi:hypothetical protein ABN034_16750 [Actinopolymorpha sp. B11F2]|uniref:hypothetical protein n=1 Tax=Actinopolymorpha sp. B11F2 TaxID=3160862 RepID=UPI0032E4BE30